MYIAKTQNKIFKIDIENLRLQISFHISPAKKEYEFKNIKEMSAMLRDEMGLDDAWEFLHKAGVPYNNELWSLNHTNLVPSLDFLTTLDNLTVEKA